MSKAKWLVVFLLALAVAVPSYAVELTLGGFPSYFRTRARFIKDATFLSALDEGEFGALGFRGDDDNIQFIDTRLRLTPQLVLSDAVTLRAQVDVADNYIWGGVDDNLVRDVVFESVSSSERFRGALLVQTTNVLFNNLGLFGVPSNDPIDDPDFFNVRMLHADIVLPSNLGFVRIGRQPFDWGIGILANGGWDPLSDLGFVLDRFLYLKSFPIGAGSFTFVFVSDKLSQGNTLVNGSGDGYDIGAVALVYNQGPVTIGAYDFPYIHQTNFGGTDLDLKWMNLWSGLLDIKTDVWRFVAEAQGAFGKIETDALAATFGTDEIDIDWKNIIGAARIELYPGFPVNLLAIEGGLAFGDEITPDEGNFDYEGNVIAFSPAYNIDNLLFKHMIPTIYGLENSVINAYYGRAWGTVKLLDDFSITPQVLVAFNDETDNPLLPDTNALGIDPEVDRYLGTEFEATLTWEVVPGVNFDLIGSFVWAGSGLKDLQEQTAAATCASDADPTDGLCGAATDGDFDAEDYSWAAQGRLLVFIDQFFKQ